MNAVTLRPAGPEDRGFVLDVRRASMAEYHRLACGWDDNQIEATFVKNLALPATQIVLLAGEPVGVLTVLRGPQANLVFRIALLPQAQNQGIGSFLLRSVQERSAPEGRPVRLSVYKCNPAAQLYLRLGFQVITETDTSFYMLWCPSAGGSPDRTER
jgi:ribosomal protein S18 acetylase RimI-like enzyme